jgi:hypothetical protein
LKGVRSQESGVRRKKEGGRRKKEGGRRKKEGGRRKEEVRKAYYIIVFYPHRFHTPIGNFV